MVGLDEQRSRVPFRAAAGAALIEEYRAAGWWGEAALVDDLRRHATERPEHPAYIGDHGTLTWRQLDAVSDRFGRVMCDLGHRPGDRVAMLLPDSATVHAVMLGLEKAGVTTVGIGSRAGIREIAHLVTQTGARTLVMGSEHRGEPAAKLREALLPLGVALDHLVEVPFFEADLDAPVVVDGAALDDADDVDFDQRRIGPDDLFLINSTSGTTGLPKCVLHTQNRWRYFHRLAAEFGDLTADDVFFGAVPAPFGFGLWTSHFTPLMLGATTVVAQRFRADRAIEAMREHHVTVLCCVSTQFLMILNDPALVDADLTSLRAMFTGGEAVPADRARQFEERTGCCVLQFFGSNETGVLSGTRLSDPPEVRFHTAGRIIPEMQVRLYDRDGLEQVSGEGRPACRGPANCIGYLEPEANAKLFTPDGWMLMGDLGTIDDEGYVRVTGRTSDFIIRGGKNISAAQVEEEVGTHPSVALAAAVALPDDVFGERVLAYVELQPGSVGLTLDDVRRHLLARGTSVELIPEALEVLDELPRSSGGKIAKGQLSAMARDRAAAVS